MERHSMNEPQRPQPGAVDLQNVQHGWDVLDQNGEKVGDVANVQDGQYLVVSRGFIFTSERYIPVSAIDQVGSGQVRLNVTKHEIEQRGWDQPPVAGVPTEQRTTSTGAMAPTEEITGTTASQAAQPVEREPETTRVDLTEEELRVGKHEVERGRVGLHTDVVEEEQSVNVPLEEESVQVTRHRFDTPQPASSAEIKEEDIEIPVYGEEADISKEAVTYEEVDITKTPRERQERRTEKVRREELRVEGEGDVDIEGNPPRDVPPAPPQ